MVVDVAPIGLVRRWPHFDFGAVLEPYVYPLAHRVLLSSYEVQIGVCLNRRLELYFDLCLCFTEDIFVNGFAGFGIAASCVAAFPTAIFPLAEATPEVPDQIPAAPEPLSETVPVESDETEDSQPPEETTPLELFTEVNETVYATGTVNIREKWTSESSKVGSLSTGNSITRTGIGKAEADGWSRVSLSDGSIAFISNSYLSTTKPAAQQASGSGGQSGSQSGKSGGQSGGGQSGSQTQQTPAPSGSDDDMAAFLKELEGSKRPNVDTSGKDYSPESTSKATTNGWTETYR